MTCNIRDLEYEILHRSRGDPNKALKKLEKATELFSNYMKVKQGTRSPNEPNNRYHDYETIKARFSNIKKINHKSIQEEKVEKKNRVHKFNLVSRRCLESQ